MESTRSNVQPSANENEGHDGANDSSSSGCCQRFKSEFACSSPWFGSTDTNGKTLDLERSFCCVVDGGKNKWWIVLLKFIFWGFTCSAYIGGWIDTNHPEFYMAYMTLWTGLYSFLYQ